MRGQGSLGAWVSQAERLSMKYKEGLVGIGLLVPTDLANSKE